MQQGQQLEQEAHMFWGIYAGIDYTLGEYLKEIDPDFQVFQMYTVTLGRSLLQGNILIECTHFTVQVM